MKNCYLGFLTAELFLSKVDKILSTHLYSSKLPLEEINISSRKMLVKLFQKLESLLFEFQLAYWQVLKSPLKTDRYRLCFLLRFKTCIVCFWICLNLFDCRRLKLKNNHFSGGFLWKMWCNVIYWFVNVWHLILVFEDLLVDELRIQHELYRFFFLSGNYYWANKPIFSPLF